MLDWAVYGYTPSGGGTLSPVRNKTYTWCFLPDQSESMYRKYKTSHSAQLE